MPKLDLSAYDTTGFYDEMFDENNNVRPNYKLFLERLEQMSLKKLNSLQHSTDRAQLSLGMTFNVYNDNQGTERILPLDIIPRIIGNAEWLQLEKGLQQRIKALNLFIQDIYNDQKVLKDKIIPKEMIFSSASYLKELEGFKPPTQSYSIYI